MIHRPVALGLSVCQQVIVEENSRNVTLVSCFARLNLEAFPASDSSELAGELTMSHSTIQPEQNGEPKEFDSKNCVLVEMEGPEDTTIRPLRASLARFVKQWKSQHQPPSTAAE